MGDAPGLPPAWRSSWASGRSPARWPCSSAAGSGARTPRREA